MPSCPQLEGLATDGYSAIQKNPWDLLLDQGRTFARNLEAAGHIITNSSDPGVSDWLDVAMGSLIALEDPESFR